MPALTMSEVVHYLFLRPRHAGYLKEKERAAERNVRFFGG
jgi:hypothetical protein